MGDNEHGIHVGFEQGGHQTELFSVPPRNTAEKWYKIGASCCLQGADTDFYRYVSQAEKIPLIDSGIHFNNFTKSKNGAYFALTGIGDIPSNIN